MRRTLRMLKMLQEKPKDFLEDKSLFLLHQFMCGYEDYLTMVTKKDMFFLSREFQKFVENKFCFQGVLHWSGLINFYSIDTVDAFNNFFILFDEFIESQESFNIPDFAIAPEYYETGTYCQTLNLLLGKRRQYPAVFFGSKSLLALYAWITGYNVCMKELTGENDNEFLSEFQEFVQNRYKYIKVTFQSWSRIILLYSTNEEAAFDRFYELLDEFLAAQEKG